MKEIYYTTREFAKLTGMSLTSVYNGVNSKKIKSTKRQKGLIEIAVIPESEVEKFKKT